MKLDINFEALYNAAKKMGAIPVEINLGPKEPIIYPPIDYIGLWEGKDVELKGIEFIDGFPTHKGLQVLLYIKDHSFRDKIEVALADGGKGNKYHVADCETIKNYRAHSRKRFDRYVITNNLSGDFPIAGTNQYTSLYIEGDTRLCVCKNCLKLLNYKGYSTNRNSVFSGFNLEE
jgi:hypothetical protein